MRIKDFLIYLMALFCLSAEAEVVKVADFCGGLDKALVVQESGGAAAGSPMTLGDMEQTPIDMELQKLHLQMDQKETETCYAQAAVVVFLYKILKHYKITSLRPEQIQQLAALLLSSVKTRGETWACGGNSVEYLYKLVTENFHKILALVKEMQLANESGQVVFPKGLEEILEGSDAFKRRLEPRLDCKAPLIAELDELEKKALALSEKLPQSKFWSPSENPPWAVWERYVVPRSKIKEGLRWFDPMFIQTIENEIELGNPVIIFGDGESEYQFTQEQLLYRRTEFQNASHEVVLTGIRKVSCLGSDFYAVKLFNSLGGNGNYWIKLDEYLSNDSIISFLKNDTDADNESFLHTMNTVGEVENPFVHPLFSPLMTGDLRELERFLSSVKGDALKTFLKWEDYWGRNGIFLALEMGKWDAAQMFHRFEVTEKTSLEVIYPNLRINKGMTPLFVAASRGDIAAVDALLRVGADKNLAYEEGKSAAFEALVNGHFSVAKMILRYGTGQSKSLAPLTRAELNSTKIYEITPLMKAAYYGKEIIVKALLDAGADKSLVDSRGANAAFLAFTRGHFFLAQLILRHGTDLSRSGIPLVSAELESLILNDGTTLLMEAARKDDMEVVKELLYLGIDKLKMNDSGYTAAFLALSAGHIDAAHFITRHRPWVWWDNTQLLTYEEINLRQGLFMRTPLMQAALVGNLHAIMMLLESGADKYILDKLGASALYIALVNGNIAAAKLIRHFDGSKVQSMEALTALPLSPLDLNPRRIGGWTPLMDAAYRGKGDAVVALLREGADPGIMNGHFQSAVDLAYRNGHFGIGKAILRFTIDKRKQEFQLKD